MKKIIMTSVGIWLSSLSLHAQLTTTENYIQTKTYLNYNGTQATKVSETVQYFDGLGRLKQTVHVKGSPSEKDVVNHIEYDGFGRQTKEYLSVPQASTQNGAYYTTPLINATQPNIYGSEKIYAETKLENSPLDRIKEKINVGTDWSGKPLKFSYDANEDGEVRKYVTETKWVENRTKTILKVATSNSANGFYMANQLYKNTLTDEDGIMTTEFRNLQGQVVLERKSLDGSTTVDTYYVYNEYEKLAFAIPPNVSNDVKKLAPGSEISTTILNELCYQYCYDKRLRLVEKRIPGKGWEYMVYDRADRLVATQDANLRAKGQWMYTKYDQFSRVIMTGICQSMGNSRLEEQDYVDTKGNNNETLSSGVTINYSGMDVYYSVTQGYPKYDKVYNFLSLNYYDTYPPYSFNPLFPATILGQAVITDTYGASDNTQAKPTVSLVKNTEASDIGWTKNYSYYDTKGRSIGSYSINHLGGFTRTESKLDFAGVPQMAVTKHKRLNTDTERIITETFEYDNQNRLKKHWHQVDSQPQELLTENTYNELSQLSNKKVGTNLQSIDYAYNIRGWLTKINDPSNLNGKLFGYSLKYQNPSPNNWSSSPKYNGKISEVDWKTSYDGILKRYDYGYDSLNRLNNGIYLEPDVTVPENGFNESLNYDLDGNFTLVFRTKKPMTGTTPEAIDNLKYTYSGTRLKSVKDVTQNFEGYPAGGNTIGYDDNGNMTNHLDKGITSIKYNFLNLPTEILTDKLVIEPYQLYYTYRSDGTKISKKYKKKVMDVAGNYEKIEVATDYLDGFQYSPTIMFGRPSTDLKLQFVATSEGYFDFEKNKYVYNYRDHLGNVRLSYLNDGGIKVIEENNYYPLGLRHAKYGYNNEKPYKYLYNGKELQETGMYDYGARMYMADLGRWGAVDPLAEKFFSTSAYAYVANDPINAIDPDGRDIVNITGGVRFTGSDAKLMFRSLQSMTSSGSWRDIKAFHFVQERLTPNIYKHTLNSFRRGKPELLHYDSDSKNNARRRQQATAGIPTMPGYQRDEYPYASTFEGGKQPDGSKAHVMLVPTAENNWQGVRELRPLYRGLKTGDAFLVVPVPINREPEDVKEEALEKYRTPAPVPVVTPPDFGRPIIPYKMWPVFMGAAVVVGLSMVARFVPIP